MRMPYLLSGHSMTPAAMLRPVSLQLSLQTDGQSTASMVLDSESPDVPIGSWIQVWAPNGEMCVMFVKSRRKDYVSGNITLSLSHTFQLLSGMVVFGEVTAETMSGVSEAETCSVTDAIDYLLGQQSETLWTRYQCDFSDEQGWKFTNSDIYGDLTSLTDSIMDCQWEFDQSVFPWRLSLKAIPADATMEMRRSRNMETLQINYDRSGMYTRVYPTGKNNLHISGDYLDQNTATYGVIAQVITDSTIGSEGLLQAWAAKQLSRNSVPKVSVSVSGYELSETTGESMDRFVIGRKCRIPLPEYGETVTERLTELSWADCIGSPEAVTCTLANELRTITGVLNEKARGGGGGSRKANTEHDCELEEFNNADIWINRDSVWAVCGSYTVYKDPVTGEKVLRVNEGTALKLMRNGTEYGLYDEGNLTAGVIVQRINGTTETIIRADKVNLQGYVTATDLSTVNAKIDNLTSGQSTATSLKCLNLSVNSGSFYMGTDLAWKGTIKDGDGVTRNVVKWG